MTLALVPQPAAAWAPEPVQLAPPRDGAWPPDPALTAPPRDAAWPPDPALTAPLRLDAAVRRDARTLHAACAELLPGYASASREQWRQSLLTAGCLDGPPRRPAAQRAAPPLIVEDVVQPSDVLCGLWLARRCGLFSPGSACGDAVGRRSACEIIPAFADGMTRERRDEVLAVLRANTAWRAHRMARRAA